MPRERSALPADVLAALLAHVAAAPSLAGGGAAARIKHRVLERVAPAAWRVLEPPHQRSWVDKADRKILFDDGCTRSRFSGRAG